MANLTISNYGDDKWMPKLLRSRRLWARHYEAASKQLGLKVTRPPSDTTFRRILQKLDFQALTQQFEQWVNSTFTLETGEWVAIDGKSIRGTVIEPGTAH